MIKSYYHMHDGIHIAKTITQNPEFQLLIEEHLLEFTEKTRILIFHSENVDIKILSKRLNILSEEMEVQNGKEKKKRQENI